MIYTRNKQSFKTKNSKIVTTTNKTNTTTNINSNGMNLIEQLKSRIQNKNSNNAQTTKEKQLSSNNSNSRNNQNQVLSNGLINKNSKTYQHQKVSISKYNSDYLNINSRNEKNKYAQENQNHNSLLNQQKNTQQQQFLTNQQHQNNAFKKVKRQQFFQLISSPQSLEKLQAKQIKQQYQTPTQTVNQIHPFSYPEPSIIEQRQSRRSQSTQLFIRQSPSHLKRNFNHPSQINSKQLKQNKFYLHEENNFDQLRNIYQSPINLLEKGRETGELEESVRNYQRQNNNSKKNQQQQQISFSSNKKSQQESYNQIVKKWKNKQVELTDNNSKEKQRKSISNETKRPQIFINKKSQPNNKPQLLSINKNKKITNNKNSLFSNTISITIQQQFHNPSPNSQLKFSTSSPSQQQYINLLEHQIQTLKQSLTQTKFNQNQLYNKCNLLVKQNEIVNHELNEKINQLQLKQKQLQFQQQNKFIIQKYQRLFQRMRNLLMTGAMELIEIKNSILVMNENFGHLKNSKQKEAKQLQQKNGLVNSSYSMVSSIISPASNQQRIKSINQYMAKVEETIEVSYKVLRINNQRKSTNNNYFNSQNQQTFSLNQKLTAQIKQLQESVFYKDKIIQKLRQEIQTLYDLQQRQTTGKFNNNNSQLLPETKNSINISSTKQFNKVKPYTYVEQINLLRHQINRLTDQNCVLYKNIVQNARKDLNSENNQNQNLNSINIKSQSQLQNNKSNNKNPKNHSNLPQNNVQHPTHYPNQSRIQQISLLIDNLSYNKIQSGQKNSKVEYWVNGNKNTQTNSNDKKHQNNHIKTKPSPSDTKTKHISSLPQQQKIQYSPQQFTKLVQQFKSSLSGHNNNNPKKSNLQNNPSVSKQKNPQNSKSNEKKRKITLISNKKNNPSAEKQISVINNKKDNSQMVQSNNYKTENDVYQYKSTRQQKYTLELELPTFRTPNKQENEYQNRIELQVKSQFKNQRQNIIVGGQGLDDKSIHNPPPSPIPLQSYKQTISRLQYQKQFLQSELETISKQNQQLSYKIKQLQQSHLSQNAQKNNQAKQAQQQQQILVKQQSLIQQYKQKNQIVKQELYKIKLENQELVDRVVELENQLLLLNSETKKNKNQFLQSQNNNSSILPISATAASLSLSKQSQFRQKLLIKQQQIEKLMKQNIFLHQQLQSINNQLREEKKINHEIHQMYMNTVNKERDGSEFSPILAPSFQTLLVFLKKLPSQQGHYHGILLKLIQGYEKKVAQIREENAFLRTKHKQIQQFLLQTIKLLQKVDKNLISSPKVNLLNSIKSINHSQNPQSTQQQKIGIQIKSLLTRYQKFSKLSQNQKSQQFFITNQKEKLMSLKSINNRDKKSKLANSHQQSDLHTRQQQILLEQQLQLQLNSRITYYLMFLRSLTYGIGSQDLQLIQQQLKDYLKQLKKRIPTVLERQQFEQENMSSYNVSVVEEDQVEDQI